MTRAIRHLDLFSGIGGFALAVRWIGGQTVGFVELDPWCRRVLAKNFPGVPQFEDVKEFQGDECGPVDLVTGGYPCQPFSVAGQRRGAEDDRHLWPHMRRIIDTTRPRFVLAENVAGHISMGLDTVLAEMEADGYTAGAVVVPAGAVNALHRRDRIWIMAHRDSEHAPERGQREDASREGGERGAQRGRGDGDAWQVADGSAGEDPCRDPHADRERELQPEGSEQDKWGWTRDLREGMADPDRAGQRQQCGTEPVPAQHPAAEHGGCDTTGAETPRSLDDGPDGVSPDLVRSRWRDASWEMGLPRVVVDEKDRRPKLQAAGNAIVPEVAYELLRVIVGISS